MSSLLDLVVDQGHTLLCSDFFLAAIFACLRLGSIWYIHFFIQCLPCFMWLSCSLQKLEVSAELRTDVYFFLHLFCIFHPHLAAMLLTEIA